MELLSADAIEGISEPKVATLHYSNYARFSAKDGQLTRVKVRVDAAASALGVNNGSCRC